MARVESIPLKRIQKGKRYREDYKDISKLANSIREKGLIQPIAVYEDKESNEFLLLAGGRRLKAHEVLECDSIMCRIYERSLDEMEIRAIELAENIDREDLTFVERINLEREIHELYLKIHGPKISTNPDAPGHSLADTARLLNKTPATLTIDMQIAKAMEDFPDLQWDKMKNKEEAKKTIKKIYSSIGRMENAKIVEKKLGTGDSRKRRLYDAFVVGDFFKHADQLPDNYFNIVEVDPPYAIKLQQKKKGYSYEGYNEISSDDYISFVNRTLSICYQKMAENSWIIFWFGPDPWFNTIGDELRNVGFGTTGLVGLWVKGVDEGEGITATGQTHRPNSRLANAYEMFYYGWRGSPILAKPGRSNVFGYKPIPPGQKSHPTERPQELMEDILNTFGVEGSRVLVPFAGSGSTIMAASRLSMIPLGFDLSQNYKDSYILRIDQLY